MKNVIAYYYNLYISNILHTKSDYYFESDSNYYTFKQVTRPLEDINYLYELNIYMIKKRILMHEIVPNKDNNVITYINSVPFILMMFSINPNTKISLYDIYLINNNTIDVECNNILKRSNWVELWESKVDYIESQINELGTKYSRLNIYVNYYIGMCENAIYYVKEALNNNEKVIYTVSHKRICSNDTLCNLYDPLNCIVDFRVRDIAEYIKNVFFYENEKRAYDALINYFKNNNVYLKEALLMYGRLLYPSYFFDLYEDIVNEQVKEEKIDDIVIKSTKYEKFLYDVYVFLSNLYRTHIPSVDWIIKRSFI